MMDQIGEELSLSQRPLIIDEADFLVQKRMIEVVRDIYESSQATIILIGEEAMPVKLQNGSAFTAVCLTGWRRNRRQSTTSNIWQNFMRTALR